MTKLFSMKSLACAGAMAFALTLAAAPQANAEEEAAAEAKLAVEVNYETGELTVTPSNVTDELVKTDDGTGIYLGSGKTADKIKKYTLVSDADGSDDALTFDISGMLGKATTIGVAFDADGTGKTTTELVAAPSGKAKLVNDTITFSDKDLTTSSDYFYQYKVGTYGEWEFGETVATNDEEDSSESTTNLTKAIQRARVFGSTIYIRVADAKADGEEGIVMASPWSKELKVKVAAKAKAPTISIKTAGLTKAFEWKMGDKVEYMVTVGGKSTEWKQGDTNKLGWNDIIRNAANATTDENGLLSDAVASLVDGDSGDAIAESVQIQVRTKAIEGKKAASNISVLSLEPSLDSPTYTQIKVDADNASKKTATASAAAITTATLPDGYAAQYSTDGKAWKKLTAGKTVTLQSDKLGTNSTIQLRLVGSDAKKVVLPSAVTTVTIPKNGAEDVVTAVPVTKDETAKRWKVPESPVDYKTGEAPSTGDSDTE